MCTANTVAIIRCLEPNSNSTKAIFQLGGYNNRMNRHVSNFLFRGFDATSSFRKKPITTKQCVFSILAGEDGCLKIWSRIGMLRTKLVVNGEPILSADWNSDSTKIVYTQHDMLCIKSLKANVKTIRVRNLSRLYLRVL